MDRAQEASRTPRFELVPIGGPAARCSRSHPRPRTVSRSGSSVCRSRGSGWVAPIAIPRSESRSPGSRSRTPWAWPPVSTRPGDTWTRSGGSGSATWCAGRSRAVPAVGTPSRGSSGTRTGARWSTPWVCRTRVRRPPPEPSAGRRREAPGWRASPTRTCPTCSRPTRSLEPFVDGGRAERELPERRRGAATATTRPTSRTWCASSAPAGRARCSSSSRRSAPRWSARWCSRSPRSREQEGADALTVLEHPPGPGRRTCPSGVAGSPAAPCASVTLSCVARRPRGDGAGAADQRERGDPHAGGRVRGDRGRGDHGAGVHRARLRRSRGWWGSSRRGSSRRCGAAGSTSPRSWGPPEPNRGVACPGPGSRSR